MFCQNCGKEAEEIGRFCSFCGGETGFVPEEETASAAEQAVQANNVQEQPQVVTSVERKKMTRKQKLIAVISVLVLILAVIFYQLGSDFSNPESVAKNYFTTLSKANYSSAFDYLIMPKSDVLSKDNYINYMKKKFGDTPWVVSYKINSTERKVNSKLQNNGLLDQLSQLGKKEYKSLTKQEDNLLTKNVYISYITKDSNSQETLTLKLIKSNDKKLLIFDNWKVDPTDMLQAKWIITVPKGASLFINGKEIPKTDINQDDTAKSTSNYDNQVSYNPKTENYEVKNIFSGEYDIKVTMPSAKEYTQKHKSTDTNTKISLVPDDKLKASIEDFIKRYNQDWMTAISKKDINIIKDYIIENSPTWQRQQSYFSYLGSNSTQYNLKSIDFGDVYLDDESHIRIKDTETWEYSSSSYNNTYPYKWIYNLQKVNDKWMIYSCNETY